MTHITRSVANSKNWLILAGLCIRRPVVITPELSPMEQKVTELYRSIELEKSYLSSHELKNKIETAQLSKAGAKKKIPDASATEESLLTTTEKELMWESEADKFIPADRVTENDRSGNMKSAWRLLDRSLVLLTKKSIGESSEVWTLPTEKLEKGQNLRQAVDILASKVLPASSKFQIFGNAPSAVYVRENANVDNSDVKGIQIYFYNAYVDRHWHGHDLLLPDIKDFAWVTRGEMKKFIKNTKLLKVLRSFIQEY